MPSPTTKELAQFKMFALSCPKNTAFAILRTCLMNFPVLSNDAKWNYNAFPIPTRPTLGFLLKYKTVAINFALTYIKPKAVPVPAQQIVDLPVPINPTTPASKPHHKKATKAEVLAILEEED